MLMISIDPNLKILSALVASYSLKITKDKKEAFFLKKTILLETATDTPCSNPCNFGSTNQNSIL